MPGKPEAIADEVEQRCIDRATLPWHAGQVVRSGENHGGLILFRRSVRSTDYGQQARLLTELWTRASGWDWIDRIVYLPKSP